MAELKRKFHPMPGLQSSVQRLKRLLDESSDLDHLLIRGPRGVGKSYFLDLFKEHCGLAGADIVHLNCAAIYPGLADSELFGHVKGAFTGAGETRNGFIRTAEKHRVMILEELNSLPKEIQAKLLVFLETFTFYPVGSRKKQEAPIRVIATANEEEETENRLDLLDRFKLYVNVPPLHRRRDDIVYFIAENYPDLVFRPLVLFMLYSYPWPGNLRELNRTLLEMKAGVEWSILEEVYKGFSTVSDGLARAFNRNFKYTNKKIHKVRPPDNMFGSNVLKIRLSSEPMKSAYGKFVMIFGHKEPKKDEPFDYKLPEIVAYTNKYEEVGTGSTFFLRDYFANTYGSDSIYSDQCIHLAENLDDAKSKYGQVSVSTIADFLISTEGAFPEVLKEITDQIGHGGQARLSKILGVPKNTISRWVNKGIIPSQ